MITEHKNRFLNGHQGELPQHQKENPFFHEFLIFSATMRVITKLHRYPPQSGVDSGAYYDKRL